MLIPDVLGHGDYRVLVVDDDSSDGTGEVADAFACEHSGPVDILHRRGRRRLRRSYVDAFRRVLASDADLACQMDADLSYASRTCPRWSRQPRRWTAHRGAKPRWLASSSTGTPNAACTKTAPVEAGVLPSSFPRFVR